MMIQSMSLSGRFTCALVCKAWAEEAAAATRSIILRDRIQDLSCLQRWLEKHGGQVEVLQLYWCCDSAVLTALPCPQLQDLLLWGGLMSLHSRVWSDLAAATKWHFCLAGGGTYSLSAGRCGVSTDSIARPGAAHLEQRSMRAAAAVAV